MREEELLQLLITKLKLGELRLINEIYKRKYIEIDVVTDYKDFKVIDKKCSIEPYKTPTQACKDLEKDGYTIKIVGTYDGFQHVTKTFNTWKNKAHRGYGDTIVGRGYSSTVYLNFDNNGKKIILPRKALISEFKSPQLKYYE